VVRVGISAIHVRPGASGSHQPYLTNFVEAISKLNWPGHEYLVIAGPDAAPLFESASFGENTTLRIVPLVHRTIPGRVAAEQLVLPWMKRRARLDVMHYAGTAASIGVAHSDVVTIHHDSATQRGSMGRLRNLYYDQSIAVASRAGACVVPTAAYGVELKTLFPRLSLNIVPIMHGTAEAFFEVGASRMSQVSASTHMLAVTNGLAHKNLAGLLRGFDEAIELGVDLPLLVAGRVTEDDVGAVLGRSRRAELGERLIIAGERTHDEIARLHNGAACAVFVSLVETFGMPLSEAMAAGVPVVASDIPVHREVGAAAPAYVDPRDPTAIAETIRNVLFSLGRQRSMAEAGRARALELTWDHCARNHADLYDRLAASAA
jgi:glycosyltransferase involved in cell wall biosynthesis